MKRFLAVALFVGSFSITARVHGEDKPSEPKHRPTAPPAPHGDNRDLFESAANDIGLIKKDTARSLSPTEQTACLLMAADLADLGGAEKEAKHLRDEAAKDQPPTGILDLLTRRQAQLDALEQQVSALRRLTHTEQQIQVDVRMIEVPRSKLDSAGINVSGSKISDKSDASGHITLLGNSPLDRTTAAADANRDCLKNLADLEAQGIAKNVASPTLITVSGRPAFFQSGGEFPYPQPRPGQEPGIEFKRFGIQVDLVAISLSTEKLRLEVKTRLSQRDDASSVEIHGVKVPGLSISEWDVGVELKSGETLLVGEMPLDSRLVSQANAADQPSDASANATVTPPDKVLLLVLKAQTIDPLASKMPRGEMPNHASSSKDYGINK
jgi:hypothetical protein